MKPEVHTTIYRKDYRPPTFHVDRIEMGFDLDPSETLVAARLHLTRQTPGPLSLDGEGLTLLRVVVDDVARSSRGYTLTTRGDRQTLAIDALPDRCVVDVAVRIAPITNTSLMGLYVSGGNFFTQCEAEGFRKIVFFPDRPDVMARFTVMLRAERRHYPVLLSNGNLIESGDLGDGRHYAKWEDPFPKPSYLFALVAGNLSSIERQVTTRSGRPVLLQVYTERRDLSKAGYALDSLERSLRWDEQRFGLELDLDRFMIVAVGDFNMGAMENKGLNIFNSRYILADFETATDADFDAIAGVVGHEYFHNWSGNRVTCRDWFQLSLKEGFTVFRDQCFSADIGSQAVKRIDDVRLLRAAQFPEDAGPLAHAVRPDSYLEITNFYTATIYNKGAELIRMMRTMLGAEAFRAGSDLYFERHDGEAATCDDFVAAMEQASGADLSRFKRWYEQAGTPRVTARLVHDAAARTATLHLAQSTSPTPGQPDKKPMQIPLVTALIGADSGTEIAQERLVVLVGDTMSVLFEGVDETPLLSINRGFSAPVIVDVERQPGELERLAACDGDPFARYEALQELMFTALVAGARGEAVDQTPVIAAMRDTLTSNTLDAAYKGEALTLPSEALIGDRMSQVDPDAIHAAREGLRAAIGQALAQALGEAQAAGATGSDLSSAAKGVRRLKSVALALIAAGDPAKGAALAKAQYDSSDNMTDRQGALAVLTMLDGPARTAALDDYYRRFAHDALVIDKWFALQAGAPRSDTIDTVEALLKHPDFTMKNPNRLRAVAGNFAAGQWVFHEESGRGYRLLGDLIIAVDAINPQTASVPAAAPVARRFAD